MHIPAAASQRHIFSLADLNAILSQASHWNDRNLRMWVDRLPVNPDHYNSMTQTLDGMVRRPDPAKIETAFARGATIVLNETEQLTPSLRAVANCLEHALVGSASANIYCSPGERQAFDSHYDDHEVFAFHIAGEKRWRIYEGRIDNPVGQPSPRPNLQQLHDQSKGKVLFEQTMKPGDLLYLPRGQYHDALASGGLSLHVTFSVFPMNGLALFKLLETASIPNSLFRDDLPAGWTPEAKAQLRERLSELSGSLGALITSEAFADQVEAAQRALIRERREATLKPQGDKR
ncbi:JmjC domain-containing protein [Hyphococcus sp.]|uniref:JmjC domain-containing protein n=1 Tax=Hyphococcus sp. TaxID=2038636 RepID=UPI002084D308|nr:MAG: hypothetical protein DHS20C04_07560 [Marinicaulis sp.]